MDTSAIEKAIRDIGLPGRLVALDGKMITLDLLNDRSERLERHELGISQFCDLLLDWRQKLIAREVVTGDGSSSLVAAPAEGPARN